MPKPTQNSEAVGHDSEGDRKDGSNGAGPGRNINVGGTVGAIIWQRYLGGDWGDAQGPNGVPPLVGATDHRDDGETRGRRRVGIPSGRGGDGCSGDSPHWGVHQEAADNHIGDGGLPPRICTVNGGGADDGDEPVGTMVGSRRGK